MRKLLLPLRLAWWTLTLQLQRRLRLRADKRLLLESGLFDAPFYLRQNPDVAAARVNPLVHYIKQGWREHRNPHPFFDVAFYLERYPDVAQAGSEPLAHYLHSGGIEKRDPHPVFDSAFYLERNPDAALSGLNPLVHFLHHSDRDPNRYFDVAFYLEQNPDVPKTAMDAVQHYLREGAAQGRNPHPLFDTRWYLSKNPEVAATTENPLLHFLQRGRREGRDPHPIFDTKFYLEHRPDVVAAKIPPVDHYLHSGASEGRDPHPLFDTQWYLAQLPDALRAGENPLLHYLRRGWKEKRSPCAFFDGAFYLEHNPDVAEGDISALHHYLVCGAAEGRDPSPWFDTDWYITQNPEVATAGWNPLVHYVRVGMREGRRPRPLIDTQKKAIAAKHRRPRIVFVSGESETAGHRYRVLNIASALSPRSFETVVMSTSELPNGIGEIADADIVWFWRVRLTPHTATLAMAARDAGAAILFDVDDLVFRPELAVTETIDGIRTQKISETEARDSYGDMRLMLLEADRCTVPTIPLAREIRALKKPATVIPNGFDRETFECARSAMRQRRSEPGDGLVRIGYASGSLTHQRDFAVASQAIAAILGENPSTRLVLFRGATDIAEFPELDKMQDQIEWRDPVPFQDLPREYARFDINIAPLEIGNPFCEAKSELKFFEAALAGVPTIASATQPFADAIRPGETAFLAATADEWYQSLSRLLQDRDLRYAMADRAYQDVLWLYGPERRSLLVTRLVNEFLAPC